MFVPEAYITATRQFVAQANNWSLEELALEVFAIFVLFLISFLFQFLSFSFNPQNLLRLKNLVKDRTFMLIVLRLYL